MSKGGMTSLSPNSMPGKYGWSVSGGERALRRGGERGGLRGRLEARVLCLCLYLRLVAGGISSDVYVVGRLDEKSVDVMRTECL